MPKVSIYNDEKDLEEGLGNQGLNLKYFMYKMLVYVLVKEEHCVELRVLSEKIRIKR